MSKLILTAQTAAANSTIFKVRPGKEVTIKMYISPEAQPVGGDDLHIEYSFDGGTTFRDVWLAGAQLLMDETKTILTITGPGIYRVAKGITSNAVGAYLSSWGDL